MVTATKLVDAINLKLKNEKYDFVEVILKSYNSDISDYLNLKVLPAKNSAKIRLTIIL